jgi:hypothetical protein
VASLQITKADDPWIEWRPIEQRAALALGAILHGMLADTPQTNGRKPSRKAGER